VCDSESDVSGFDSLPRMFSNEAIGLAILHSLMAWMVALKCSWSQETENTIMLSWLVFIIPLTLML
jgi:hypothetical protein